MQPPFLSYFWTSDSKLCLEPQVTLSLLSLFYLCSSRPFSALFEVGLTWFPFALSCIYLFLQQAWDVPPPHTILDSCKIIRTLKVSASDARELLNGQLTNAGRDCKQSSAIRRRNGQGEICGDLEQAVVGIASTVLKSNRTNQRMKGCQRQGKCWWM